VCFVVLFAVGTYYYEDDPGKPRTRAWVSLAVTAAALAVMVLVAARAQRRSGSRGYLLGVLLGIGLSALPLGLCFAIVGESALNR
jgi:hypothetical protein